MRNIKLIIEYDGTRYNGWQAQHKNQRRKGGKVRTIQGVVEDAIFELLGEKVRLISSGRTDAGVHAKKHVANFRTSSRLEAGRVKKALNALMPPDIAIKEAEDAGGNFHSQYDALSKTYRYLIWNADYISPFLRKYAYHFSRPLDISAMKKEAKTLIGRHDFSAFKSAYKGRAKIKEKKDSNVRTIKCLRMRSKKNSLIEVVIEADGFLYNMARNIVGTLIEAGRGRFSAGCAKRILISRDRKLAGPTAPARGLCLIDVEYT